MILFEISREAFLPFLVFSFLTGIVLGAIYDVFRIRRKAARRAGKRRLDFVLTLFEDVIFCLFATVSMILVTYKLYFGIPRWYSYGACAVGFFLWQKTVGRLIMKLSDKIINLIVRTLLFVKRKLVKPAWSRIKKLTKKIIAKFRLKKHNLAFSAGRRRGIKPRPSVEASVEDRRRGASRTSPPTNNMAQNTPPFV